MDSQGKRAELRESYQLRCLGVALILFPAAQVLRCGGKAQLPVSRKWVRASARKKAFGSRSRQAKCSACPTQGWVKSFPRYCRLLSALQGDVAQFLPHKNRPPGSRRCGLHILSFAGPPLRPRPLRWVMGRFCRTAAARSRMTFGGARMPPRLCLRHTASYTAKQGGNRLSLHAERKRVLSLYCISKTDR